ncbi:protein Lilipod isoform X1 [Ischnura elegans]|uniref:protein Lilipod isoform X1 n=1 Tax=Ischnura elegans TaxID=197161 RepID=UPI001ED891D2|nr:protein Lilipod isoform X1 [Ischnura elegans]
MKLCPTSLLHFGEKCIRKNDIFLRNVRFKQSIFPLSIMDEGTDIREQIFHNTVRENIIFLLLFLFLCALSYAIILKFKKRDKEDFLCADEDEATVSQISILLCTVSLAVSVGAVLLLPMSIAGNEVLLLYPKSYYVKWLNTSLVQGLWNYIFLFSNLSLFVLLPFAYLFTESEGFTGYRKGIMARVYETFTILSLLAVLVAGMTYIMSALIDKDQSAISTLLSLWSYYLPFLYSCISFLGVLMLLLCTPLGFVHLFTVVGKVLVKPQFMCDLSEEYYIAVLEENCLRRKLAEQSALVSKAVEEEEDMKLCAELDELKTKYGLDLKKAETRRQLLDRQRHTSYIQRNLVNPVAVLVLLILTSITILTVALNTLGLLVGIKALPLSTQQLVLGMTSLSSLGPAGAALEVVLIFYLAATSSVGLYTLPMISRVQPRYEATPLPHLILNCAITLVLSSALPLLARILGITNFDLLGDFGRIEWLGNFKIVLMYNLVFASSTTICLMNKFTSTVRRELCVRLKLFLMTLLSKETTRLSTSINSGIVPPAKED